ncbi:hypothetical protein F8388_019049 [Cannabis sativa]|uniref:Peptidase C14 caspase domain-containing protein n=1 Tax=Cannabis sativa TaxID=3483 RepID=A0A7J6FCB2_CANSA|nr:hypothetical protein F8388_019049 [Cannabis sativa]
MAGRRERCVRCRCGTQLLVPLEAPNFKCPICQSITQIRPNNNNNYGSGGGQDYLHNAAAKFRNVVTNMINVNTALGGYSGYYNPQMPPAPMAVAPPRPSPRPGLGSGSSFGRRRAVLCGVSYIGQKQHCKGSVNDVSYMKYFLVEKMRFPSDCLLVLTEHEKDPLRIPTRRNMLLALRWLVEGSRAGDSLVFFYSGHGSRQQDKDHDEADGVDETLCPTDYETAGKIVDDEINATIVRPLPYGATLHAIIDACYSGTVLDLPFVCRMNRDGFYNWEDQRNQSIYKGTKGGVAVSISACDDHQTSADTDVHAGFNRRKCIGRSNDIQLHTSSAERTRTDLWPPHDRNA